MSRTEACRQILEFQKNKNEIKDSLPVEDGKIQKAISLVRDKINNYCSDKTKEDRARKGAYVDVICILQSLLPAPVEGEK